MNELIELKDITSRIYTIRGIKVMLDRDLAELYEVETRIIKRNVRRHIKRFPSDFMFELSYQEFKSLRSQVGISKSRGPMNKLELIQALKESNGLSTAESQQVVELFFDAMGEGRTCRDPGAVYLCGQGIQELHGPQS